MHNEDQIPVSENELIDFVATNGDAQQFEGVRVDSLALIPSGKRVERIGKLIEKFQLQPLRTSGVVTLTDERSFIASVNQRKQEASNVYANDRHVVCVINDDGPAGPGWRDHHVVYTLPKSDAWLAWKAAAQRPMSQTDFAEFLEMRILDVLEPSATGDETYRIAQTLGVSLASPAALMTLSRGLSVRVDTKVTNAVNLSSGEAQLQFGEQHSDETGQPLKVPGAFAIAIPVFKNGDAYAMPVRLRYRVKGGEVTWYIQTQRQDESLEHALAELLARIESETGLIVLRGNAPAAADTY